MNCLVCGCKTYSNRYCAKHNKVRNNCLRKIKKKGFYQSVMDRWSLKALQDFSVSTPYKANQELIRLKATIQGLEKGKWKGAKDYEV